MRLTGPLESAALLTVLPVPGPRDGVDPRRAAVGAAGGAGPRRDRDGRRGRGRAVDLAAGRRRARRSPSLAVLTRGLHLDGLADTADGLGPLRCPRPCAPGDAPERHRPVRGRHARAHPAAAGGLPCRAAARRTAGWLALWTAVVVARLAMARTGLPGVPIADGSSLGSLVAGTVSAGLVRRLHPRASAALLVAAALMGAEHVAVAGLAGAQRRSRPARGRDRSTAVPASGWAA